MIAKDRGEIENIGRHLLEFRSMTSAGTWEASQTWGSTTLPAHFFLKKKGHFLKIKGALLCLLQYLGGQPFSSRTLMMAVSYSKYNIFCFWGLFDTFIERLPSPVATSIKMKMRIMTEHLLMQFYS